MTHVGTKTGAQPTDPVRTALDDPALRDGLLEHALAVLGKRLRHRPVADRNDAALVAFQETCVRALEKLHEYDATLPVRPWLHGIMNLVLCETIRSEAYRLKNRMMQLRGSVAIDLTPDIAETVPNRLAAEDYLGRLRVEERQVLELRFFDGICHDEIASRLGISTGYARVRLCRAIIALRVVAGASLLEDTP